MLCHWGYPILEDSWVEGLGLPICKYGERILPVKGQVYSMSGSLAFADGAFHEPALGRTTVARRKWRHNSE